jgi:Tfp pilus assembly protein PilF
MARRHGWRILTGLIVLGAQAGCQTTALQNGPETPVMMTSAPAQRGAKEREFPHEEQARICLATAQTMDKEGSVIDAIALYEKARRDNPRMTQVSRRLAVLYDRAGDTTKALEEYEKALKASPRDSALLNDLGYTYYSHGQLEDAEKRLREAVACDAKNLRAWVNLGMVLGEQGHYDEARAAFGRALPLPQAECNLAFLLTTQGKRDEAKQAYQRALSMDPTLVVARGALEKLEHPAAAPGDQTAARPAVAPTTGSIDWSDGSENASGTPPPLSAAMQTGAIVVDGP